MDGVDTIMLGSNNYLGLSSHPTVIARGLEALSAYGAGMAINPPFVTTPVHEQLSQELAKFMGVEAVLLFASCTAANHGLLSTLMTADDAIFSDAMNHASIIDGCRLSRARTFVYKSRDIASLEEKLASNTHPHRLIITDGVFSMEGSLAPLKEIIALAKRNNAMVAVDESHAAGVVGPHGRGTAAALGLSAEERQGLIYTGTLSKAFGGAGGGYIAGSYELVDELRKRARAFIFTTGISPAVAASAVAALAVHNSEPEHYERLWANTERFRSGLAALKFMTESGESPITPILIGDNDLAVEFARGLRAAGVFIPAMVFPIVAEGDARLRAQPSAALNDRDIDEALSALDKVGTSLGVRRWQ